MGTAGPRRRIDAIRRQRSRCTAAANSLLASRVTLPVATTAARSRSGMETATSATTVETVWAVRNGMAGGRPPSSPCALASGVVRKDNARLFGYCIPAFVRRHSCLGATDAIQWRGRAGGRKSLSPSMKELIMRWQPESACWSFVTVIILSGAATAAESGDAGWTSLFDGKTLAGWTQKNGTATYRVEEGAIVGKTNEGSPNSFLCSDKDYGDFELTLEVKVDDALIRVCRSARRANPSSTRAAFTVPRWKSPRAAPRATSTARRWTPDG